MRTHPGQAHLNPGRCRLADGPVLVLAGAGTGKTRTLTAGVALRIAERGIPAHRILAVTFTNKAAAEMRRRIATLLGGQPAPSWIGTFHGLGARQLRLEPQVAGLREGFDILDADDARRLLRRTIKACDLAALDREGDGGRNVLKAIGSAIGRLKDNLVLPHEAAQHAEDAAAAGNALDKTHCVSRRVSTRSTSVACAMGMPPISAISSSGPPEPWRTTQASANA